VANENEQSTRREQRRAKQQTEQGGSQSDPAQPAEASSQDIRDRNARLRAKAAADRQSKRERDRARIAATSAGLDATERLDDIFVRTTHAVTLWIRKNFRWLQWAVVLVILTMFGVQAVRYYQRQQASKSADSLMAGAVAQSGTVGDEEDAKSIPDELRHWDSRPMFPDAEQRLNAAEKNYKTTIDKFGKSGAGEYARLQLAGIKYDQKAYDEALNLYRQVRLSSLAQKDLEVRGRTIEGAGFCLEAKSDLEGALKSFRELSNLEGSLEFAVLGLYHQARILLAQGKRDNAKELLQKAQKRLSDEKDSTVASYFKRPIQEALSQIDPSSVAAAGSPDLSELLRQDPSRLQRMINNLKQKGAGGPPGDAPDEPK
jgi:predicted negative regulator of RcsB-dependent stress response